MSGDDVKPSQQKRVKNQTSSSIQKVVDSLNHAKKWLKVASIIGFTIGGIVLVCAVLAVMYGGYGHAFNVGARPAYQGVRGGSLRAEWTLLIFYGLIGSVVGFIYLHLASVMWNAVKDATLFQQNKKTENLVGFIDAQQKIWKVITIVAMVVLGLQILGGVVLAIFALLFSR